MTIQPIVEGQGEVAAVPLLLRRLRDEARAWGLEMAKTARRRRTELIKRLPADRCSAGHAEPGLRGNSRAVRCG